MTAARWIRYVALDGPSAAPPSATRLVAWGRALARGYTELLNWVPFEQRGWFACPEAMIDLWDHPRVWFLPAKGTPALEARIPPEVRAVWPCCDERGLVFVVGQALRMLGGDAIPAIASVLARGCAPEPARRYASLAILEAALVAASTEPPHDTLDPRATLEIETALGYLAVGQPHAAQATLLALVNFELRKRGRHRRRGAPSLRAPLLCALRDEAMQLTGDIEGQAALPPRLLRGGAHRVRAGKRTRSGDRDRDAAAARVRSRTRGDSRGRGQR